MALEIEPELDYRHWRKEHVSVFPAVHSSYALYSGRPGVSAGLQEFGFSSFDQFNYLGEDGLSVTTRLSIAAVARSWILPNPSKLLR